MTTLFRRDPNVATGSSVVLSYRDGRRHFVSCQPNNYSLAMSDIDQEMLTDAGHLLRADVWFSEPMLAGGNDLLFQAARAQGLATSLDINWDPYWGSADAATIPAQGFRATDLALGRPGPRQRPRAEPVCRLQRSGRGSAQITAWGAAAIVIHLGADGAGYYDRGQLTVAPAVPVRQYKNTAGTGDLLSVCMMLMHGRDDIPLDDRLRLANAIVAEFIEGKRGVIPVLE